MTEGGHRFARKVKLEIVVSDQTAPALVDLIASTAHTGNIGDGKIFVIDVVDAVKVRTGERGPECL